MSFGLAEMSLIVVNLNYIEFRNNEYYDYKYPLQQISIIW